MKITFSKEDVEKLIKLSKDRNVFIEGNIIKLIDHQNNPEFADYLEKAKQKDRDSRKMRLEVTKQVQQQNKELESKAAENDQLMSELKIALEKADAAKKAALNDLDLLQKRTQFELIGRIVEVALWIIMGVGVTTTLLYCIALFSGSVKDTTLLGNTWSNLFGILLTNSFSIIGTIMGVKYASGETNKKG